MNTLKKSTIVGLFLVLLSGCTTISPEMDSVKAQQENPQIYARPNTTVREQGVDRMDCNKQSPSLRELRRVGSATWWADAVPHFTYGAVQNPGLKNADAEVHECMTKRGYSR